MDVLTPDAGCKQIEMGGKVYTPGRDGVYRDLPDKVGRAMVRDANAGVVGVGLGHVRGYVCEACGFRAVFRTCGRCGGACR